VLMVGLILSQPSNQGRAELELGFTQEIILDVPSQAGGFKPVPSSSS
jgi:hypothetical protein